MRVLAIAFVLGVALAGCGAPAAGYPPQYELNFVRACQAHSPPAGVCQCTWDKVEAQIPRNEFDAFERMPAAQRPSSPIQRQLQSFALECMGKPAAP